MVRINTSNPIKEKISYTSTALQESTGASPSSWQTVTSVRSPSEVTLNTRAWVLFSTPRSYRCARKASMCSEETFSGFSIDFVVDAIDTLAPKLALIRYCIDKDIPIVSSMGAGAKMDATRIRIADISRTFNCPLAFVVRKRLRRMGIRKGLLTVFSEELPDRSAIVDCDEKNKKSNAGTVSYIPAVFGCLCAQAAIASLLDSGRRAAGPAPEAGSMA